MELDFIFDLIDKNGYIGLFFWLWFGTFSLPIPNEVIVMTVGLASSSDVLHPLLAFIVTFSGMVMALTTSYLIGRVIGDPLMKLLVKRRRFAITIKKSLRMIEKYHALSLFMSYFIPGLRHFVPFLYGFSKLSFRQFALFSYSGALIWLLLVFTLGYVFGDHIDVIIRYEKEFFSIIAAFAFFYLIIKLVKRKRRLARAAELTDN